MLGLLVWGAVEVGAVIVPALAGQMSADEARRFVSGKVFAFTCFDGTRGAGRVLDDMGAAGAVQFNGSSPIRHVRVPGNTPEAPGPAVCAAIKGSAVGPCFNLDKKDERSFRGSGSGMGFAYCDFRHQGAVQMLMARAVVHPRSLHPPAQSRSADASHADVSVRVETPHVESGKIEPVKSEPKSEGASELRRSTD